MFFACERKYYSRDRQSGGDVGGKTMLCANSVLQCDRSDLVSGIVAGNWKQMCSFWCPPPSWIFLSLYVFISASLAVFFCFFFASVLSWLIPRRWKLAFLIPPEATRPLQNTHFPINKYTKTFSHLSQSQTQYANKHNNHRNKVFLLPLGTQVGWAWVVELHYNFIVDILELSWWQLGQVAWILFKVIINWQLELRHVAETS